jgi:two-component system sensor histidine kinase UhpB
MSLFLRVLLANAAVLALATLLLLFSPIEISYPVTNTQATILVTGFLISVIVNMLLLRGVVAPLRRLTATMRSVEPMQPGRRLSLGGTDTDVAALSTAFNDMLDRLESERRESGRKALAAQESERQRIARELHDEVGQVLTGVVLELEHAAKQSTGPDAARLAAARESVRHSLDDVRRIARELRPEAFDDLGLQSALRSPCTTAAAHDDLHVERELELEDAVSPEVELVVYPAAVAALIRDYLDRAGRGEATPTDPLTPREVEIVKLVAEGHTSDEIAEALVIAKKTVEHHRSHILEKLGMRDRVELTRYAIRRGLVEP